MKFTLGSDEAEIEFNDTGGLIQWVKFDEYTGDNWIWLPQKQLPFKMSGIGKNRLLPFNNTFIIIGAPECNQCFIYNKISQELDEISLENKFPQNMRDGDDYNTHICVDITDTNSNCNDIHETEYLIFGNNCQWNANDEYNPNGLHFMYKAIYNKSKNSMKFINLRQNAKNTLSTEQWLKWKENCEIASVFSKAFKLKNPNHILNIGGFYDDHKFTIYDYKKHIKTIYPKDDDINEDDLNNHTLLLISGFLRETLNIDIDSLQRDIDRMPNEWEQIYDNDEFKVYNMINAITILYKTGLTKPSDLGTDWYEINGVVRKTRNNKIIPNEFIIITGNNCYEMIINGDDDYTLKFKQLSWITDNPKLDNCLYHKFKRFKDYRPGCLITYNDFILCFGGSAENIVSLENDQFKWIFIYDMIDNKWYRADIEWYLLPKQDWGYTAFILKEKNEEMICHIIGSTGKIAERPGSNRMYIDSDKTHWRLYLGLSNDARFKIWELFKQNKCLSIECWKIVFDYFDVGFMSTLLNHRFMPYNYN